MILLIILSDQDSLLYLMMLLLTKRNLRNVILSVKLNNCLNVVLN